LNKIKILVILNVDHAVLDANDHIIHKIALLNSPDQVLIAGYCVQSIDWLQCNRSIFSLQVYIFVKEKYCVSEYNGVFVEQHIDEVPQKKTISASNQFTFIVNNFIAVVLEYFFNPNEYTLICIFWMNIAQKT